jgi:hypothetical protein
MYLLRTSHLTGTNRQPRPTARRSRTHVLPSFRRALRDLRGGSPTAQRSPALPRGLPRALRDLRREGGAAAAALASYSLDLCASASRSVSGGSPDSTALATPSRAFCERPAIYVGRLAQPHGARATARRSRAFRPEPSASASRSTSKNSHDRAALARPTSWHRGRVRGSRDRTALARLTPSGAFCERPAIYVGRLARPHSARRWRQ